MLAIRLLAVFGVGLVLLGHHFRRRIAGFNRRATSAVGTVVGHTRFDVERPTAGRRHLTEARIQFRTAQGQLVETRGLACDAASPPQPPLGTAVPLLYDPSAPEEVSLTGPRGQAGVASALFWAGLVTCALAAAPLLLRLLQR